MPVAVDPTMVQRAAPVALATAAARGAEARADADRVTRGAFRFVGHERVFDAGTPDWHPSGATKLWIYHLHYFDYAVSLAWAERESGDRRYGDQLEALVDSWTRETRDGAGPGWDPYPISVRVMNWLLSLSLLGDRRPGLTERMVASLGGQVDRLARRREYHLDGNHLLKNDAALVMAGHMLAGKAAGRWLDMGRSGLRRRIEAQVNSDGMHFERSPMYHAMVLRDLLWIHALDPQTVPEFILRRMLHVDGRLRRWDGSLHQFNDAAEGMAPGPREIAALADRSGLPADHTSSGPIRLEASGYFGFADTNTGDRILIDAGVPPRHQPAHAHSGLLGFEFDCGGDRLVVDPGVCGYGEDPTRSYLRGTQAHNTLTLDEQDQSEVWSTFRMGKAARLRRATSAQQQRALTFEGAYSPYHMPGAVHVRRIEWKPGFLRVRDQIKGAAGCRVDSYLHIHPSWSAKRVSPEVYRLSNGRQETRLTVTGVDSLDLLPPSSGERPYCPHFGDPGEHPVFRMTAREHREPRTYAYTLQDART